MDGCLLVIEIDLYTPSTMIACGHKCWLSRHSAGLRRLTAPCGRWMTAPIQCGRDMRQKFAFLRRRHTDTSLSGNKAQRRHTDTSLLRSKAKQPTPESAVQWSKSFENLVLDENGIQLFRNFLKSEFSEENLEFWIACEDYKNLSKSNVGQLTEKAQQIYGDFVATQAPREVNLDSKTRFATMNCLSKPTCNMFDMAQKRVQALMEKDSYPRFLQSQMYQALLGNYKITL